MGITLGDISACSNFTLGQLLITVFERFTVSFDKVLSMKNSFNFSSMSIAESKRTQFTAFYLMIINTHSLEYLCRTLMKTQYAYTCKLYTADRQSKQEVHISQFAVHPLYTQMAMISFIYTLVTH